MSFTENSSIPTDGEYNYDDYYNEEYFYEPAAEAAINIILYVSPFLLFFSTLGNILSCIVLCRLSYEVWSTCVYLAIVSLLDLFIVYTWCGNNWLQTVIHISVSDRLLLSSVSICKVYMFLFSAVLHMDRWMMVCLAVDLFVASKHPDRVSQMCTLSRTKSVILLVTVILVCINLHYFWTYEILNIRDLNPEVIQLENYTCAFVRQGIAHSEVFENVIWPVIDISLAQIMPLAIITMFTILTIIERVRGTALTDCNEENWRKKYLLYPNAMKQLKTSMLIVCILYILTLPKLILDISQKDWRQAFGNNSDEAVPDEYDISLYARLELLHTVFSFLEYLFFTVKFYILFFVCRQFRVECFNICGQICRCNNNKTVSQKTPTRNQMSFCRRFCTVLCLACLGRQRVNRRTNVTAVNSRQVLLLSNQSSREFHVDIQNSSSTSYSQTYRCTQNSTKTSLLSGDVEHSQV